MKVLTEKEKYEILLFATAEKLKEKDDIIIFQKYQIDSLKRELAEAEYHLNPSGKKKPANLEIR